MYAKMSSVPVVVDKIPSYFAWYGLFIDEWRKAFVLDCAVKPLNVRIVVRALQPSVSHHNTPHAELRTECFRKLTAVVGLYYGKRYSEIVLCPCNNLKTRLLRAARSILGIYRSGIEIDEGKYVEARHIWSHKMDGIHLHKRAWCVWFGRGTGGRYRFHLL